MIKVKGLTKSFGEFKAIDNLELNVEKGSVFGLVGPNGAGKTTLIKHLAGVYTPDSGEIFIADRPVYENNHIKSKIIYIGDDMYFYPSYSIKDAANFYKGIYPTWSDERFTKLGEVFNIDPKQKIRRLSKGMQKQVALWLGISTCPEVILLDEPVDGLDPVMRKNLWSVVLQDVAESRTTVLISSHNLRELEDVCDHVGIMHKGKIVLEKSIHDLKGNIHKVQLAFKNGLPPEIENRLEVLHKETTGKVDLLIVKGNANETKAIAEEYEPLICETVNLTLEEIFIYELGGMGYDLKKVIY